MWSVSKAPLPNGLPATKSSVLRLAPSGLARLMEYIHQSFARNGGAKARSIGSGYGPDSLFYSARGKFHIYNTCNVWVARALEAAGYPMGILRPVTADQLMAKARQFGRALICVWFKNTTARSRYNISPAYPDFVDLRRT